MTNFIDALNAKIGDLDKEKGHIEDKIELLNELLEAEFDESPDLTQAPSPKKKKTGRPKGAKNRKSKKSDSAHAPADDLYEEAMKQLSKREEGVTSPELQEKLTKKFNPVARPTRKLGPGIVAGTKKQVQETAGRRKSDATVTADDEDGE